MRETMPETGEAPRGQTRAKTNSESCRTPISVISPSKTGTKEGVMAGVSPEFAAAQPSVTLCPSLTQCTGWKRHQKGTPSKAVANMLHFCSSTAEAWELPFEGVRCSLGSCGAAEATGVSPAGHAGLRRRDNWICSLSGFHSDAKVGSRSRVPATEDTAARPCHPTTTPHFPSTLMSPG